MGWRLLVTFIVLSSYQALGEEIRRKLDGHLFVPSTLLDSPFMTTDLTAQVGGEFVEISIPSLVEPGKSLNYPVVAPTIFYKFQLALLENLALFGSANGRADVGVGDLISIGVSGGTDLDIGAKWLFWQNENMLFSWAGGFSSKFQAHLDPSKIIARFERFLLDNSRAPTTKEREVLLAGITTLSGSIGFSTNLAWAMAINHTYGLWSVLDYKQLFNDPGNGLDFSSRVIWGLGTSIDLKPSTQVPIGLVFEGALDVVFDSNSFIGRPYVGGGVAYTGRDDFSVIIDAWYRINPIRFIGTDSRFSTFGVSIATRYYWE